MKHLAFTIGSAMFAFVGAAQAAPQCFPASGTYGAVSVTISGTGCLQNANFQAVTSVGNSTDGGACILTFSKPLAASSFTIDTAAINENDVASFALDGVFYALQSADVAASPVYTGNGNAIASGGQLIASPAFDDEARVTLGATAAATVTTLRINQVRAGGAGQPYQVCADDAGAIVAAPVPTISEWAMILLGLMLAGGTALYLQRRPALLG